MDLVVKSELVEQVRAFVDWVGTGRKLTQTGRITGPADIDRFAGAQACVLCPTPKTFIAVLIFGRLATVTRSRYGTRPRRQSSTLAGRSHPTPTNTSIAAT